MVGTVCGVISSLFVALNSIYTKKVRPDYSLECTARTWFEVIGCSWGYSTCCLSHEACRRVGPRDLWLGT